MGQVERHKRTTWFQFFWFLSDVVAILLGFGVGYVVRFHSSIATWIPPVNEIPPFGLYMLAAAATVLIWIPLFYALGLYRVERGRARHRRGDLLRGLVLGALVLATVGFFYRGASFSRLAVVLTWGMTSVLVLSGRTLVYLLRTRWTGLTPIRYAVVGDGPLVRRLVMSLEGSSYPHFCAGYFRVDTASPDSVASLPAASRQSSVSAFAGSSSWDLAGTESPIEKMARGPGSAGDSTFNEAALPGQRTRIWESEGGERQSLDCLGTVDEIAVRAEDLELDLIVMATGSADAAPLDEVFTQCQRVDLDFQFVPDVLSLWGRQVRVEDVDGVPLLRLRDLPLTGWNGVLKRTFDLVVASILLLVLSPLFLLLAVLVKATSPGPVFHRQVRVGRDRRPFEMLKFRSMRQDAEKESGPVWASQNDPRRTSIGVFLRKWSLDELPQLWNVVRGEMSLVGPRPERPVFVEEFESRVHDYYDRHRVKSGVTGWAQAHGLRGNVPIEQRTAYDLYYVENWSLWLDLRILWMTAWAVIVHRGE